MVLLQRKLLFQGSRGGPTFSGGGGGGGATFSREGAQMLISIETHITCDFPGGGGVRKKSKKKVKKKKFNWPSGFCGIRTHNF